MGPFMSEANSGESRIRKVPATSCLGLAVMLFAAIAFAPSLSLAGPSTSILTVADFNQDGISDLLAEKISGSNQGLLWVMLIDGSDASADGELLSNEFPFQLQDRYEFLAVGNFNANLDGQSQIAARKTALDVGDDARELGGLRVWDLSDDASTVNTDIEGDLIALPDPDYTLIGVGDVDGNGVDDFVFVHDFNGDTEEGLMRVYLMNISMEVEQISHPMVIPDDPDLEIFGVADVTGDDVADIVVADRAEQSLRILVMQDDATDGTSVDEQLFAYLVAPTDYDFAGFALIDSGNRADLIFVKNGAPNEGLVRVQLMPAISSGTPGQLQSFHPVNLGENFDYLGSGLVDSDTESDVVVTRNAGASDGQVEAVLLAVDDGDLAATDHVDTSTFPVLIPPAEWDERTTGPVTIP